MGPSISLQSLPIDSMIRSVVIFISKYTHDPVSVQDFKYLAALKTSRPMTARLYVDPVPVDHGKTNFLRREKQSSVL